MSQLISDLLIRLERQAKVLDLGAGDGRIAMTLAEHGATVTAVDRRPQPQGMPPEVTWIQRDIREWIADGAPPATYDAALLRHIIQFFECAYIVETLLPVVMGVLKPGGLLAIETFVAAPEPPFKNPHPSYWSVPKLQALVSGWEVLRAESLEESGPDMSGQERLFHKASLIARKPFA